VQDKCANDMQFN